MGGAIPADRARCDEPGGIVAEGEEHIDQEYSPEVVIDSTLRT